MALYGSDTTKLMADLQSLSWGEYVQRVLAKHKATYRSQRQRTGIPHSTVVGWVQNIPPRFENAAAFIRGFGENEFEGLCAAGFAVQVGEPVISMPTGSQVLDAGLQQLADQFGRPLRIQFDEADKAKLSVLDAAEALAVYRKQAEEGLI